MRRCPSFSGRPGFPRGLQVLVLDTDVAAAVEAEVQLKECGYRPITCTSSSEALLHLTNPDCAFDLLLVDVACLSTKTLENSALLAAAKTLPMVLMSALCSPGDIMVGIRQGAVDFLEKPLHLHRLKNIWQHVVRKMMGGGSPQLSPVPTPEAPGAVGAPQVAAPGGGSPPPPAAGATPVSEDSAGAGETGSNESTSDRANVKHAHEAMELDLETSSLLDAVDAALGNPLAGLTNGFSHLLMSEGGAAAAAQGSDAGQPGSTGSSAARRQHINTRFSADLPRQGSAPLHGCSSQSERKPRTSAPGHTCSSSACDSKPVLGYAAGQLPPVGPGVEWGLPTNPLQISPKLNPMAPKMPPMPWMPPMMPGGMPGGMLMPPMVMPGMPGAPPPFMLPPSMPCPGAPSPTCGLPSLPAMLSAPTPAPAPSPAPTSPPCKPAPLPMPAGVSASKSSAALLGPTSPPATCDLLSALSCSKAGQPPIGLQLKKSMSLVDLINDSLMRGGAGVQV